ncbi:CheR family methyltransferase [Lacipirellula parvula]|uniref:protein-glutamate O-methyltransferase n=1 Tax=Lacipirellula parvula TaxID=2650471 RepID=A0A5K7X8T2_9BACT|nr:protein-glutamate O-methyltransferase CheR [Lacipirellula parvula]BBO31171.1 chemotaxis protein methyltransferase CheR [Lacipirellula parvula]
MSNLTPADVDAVCDLVDNLCGICWDSSKSYLIEARLSNIFKRSGCANYGDFARKVQANLLPQLRGEVIDAVTTHETLWFRDNSPYEALKHKIFPELIDAKAGTPYPKRIRIWSAACSTGQEPYSIAMTLADVVPDVHRWDVQIVGTDISPGSVETASRGMYSDMEMGRGMDPQRLNKHFTKHGAHWKISDEIRSMCNFSTRNLHDPFAGFGPFDVIFCRNVAIYFTAADRKNIFTRMGQILQPNGWILVGSSESLTDVGPKWSPQFHCKANCYRPTLTAEAALALGVRR